ncbi:MAG: hypothetical protein DMF60_02880 [Acidobacteria bacterium]|nr:MAG: hypothetical protein DMF60_02880 [Acidobacteriota bacterium]
MKEPGKAYAATILVVVVLAQSLLAQNPPLSNKPPYDPATRPKFRALVDAINTRSRELGLIEVNDDPDQAAFIRRRMDAQLIEDFEKLYSINVEKIVTQSAAASLDYKTLLDATADLKTRATRIKYNVPLLRVVDKGEKIRYDENPDHLASTLPELSRLINSFLGSPVFRLSSPNDAELRLKTSRDLNGIIKLSETINKIAKRPTKTVASR